jgi:predicted 3-demethylubiquinone-9 3-methyltransferase (glyoxalase superfamily)
MATNIETSAQRITPFLWFNGNVEEAINYYITIFKNGKIVNKLHLPGDVPGAKGKVLTATISLNGVEFMLLDGGPQFTFNPSISFFVHCETQEEVDDLWTKLTANGGAESYCGWLQDKYGVSWQIIPNTLMELMNDPNRVKAQNVMNAMMQMRKIDVAALKRAYEQE